MLNSLDTAFGRLYSLDLVKPNVPGYTATLLLYEGPSTAIWRATRRTDGESVTLKIPRGPSASIVGTKFRNEFELLRAIDDPSVITAYAIEVEGAVPVLILEDFVGSITLQASLSNYVWPSKDMLTLWIDLACALEVIHAKKIVHRDIKPGNVLVHQSTNAIKVIDFGCASRFSSEELTLRSPSSLQGTLPYISPEQTGRANRSVDERSDLYSLGITFYELASGQRPFKTLDPMELVYAHLARKPTPLSEVTQSIPEALSQIVGKLLQKAPENRYQTASGLRHDLITVREEWQRSGQCDVFELGRRDKSHRLRIAEKLYGRELEVELLSHALIQACEGRPRLLLIDGPSGTGKTSIVQETYKELARQSGYFIRGKFDQFKRDTPLSGLVQAFQELIRQWLTEPDDVISDLKQQLSLALGRNGSVLAEVIPEIRWLMDDLSPVVDLGPIETQNRFNTVFRSFVETCARRKHPLVLFLDDLQWVDRATLELLRTLILYADDDTALLVVGAYRANEVDAAHPLMVMVQTFEQAGASIDRITVPSLASRHIEALLTDTLSWSLEESAEPAKTIWDRTQGNPFFVHQLLTLIHQNGGLVFDETGRRWAWDPGIVQEKIVSGDVIELLLERLRRLSIDAQTALGVAACMGARFFVSDLALVLEKSATEVSGDLEESLQNGLVVIVASSLEAVAWGDPHSAGDTVRFAHDRIQQAASLLITDDRRKATHLRIGRRILSSTDADALEEQLFNIVDHFGTALDLVEDGDERLRLADLFFRTGVKAKRATAYHPAMRYLTGALSLLPKGAWEDHYDLAIGIYRELNECAYLAGDREYSERMGLIALQNAKTDSDRVSIYIIQIMIRVASEDTLGAIRKGLHALSTFGVNVAETPSFLTVIYNIIRVHWAYHRSTFDDLAKQPTINDPKAIAAIRVTVSLLPSCYQMGKTFLYVMCSIIPLVLSIRRGHNPTTRGHFAAYGIVLSILGYYRRAREYANIALRLSEKFPPDPYQYCVLHYGLGAHINHWRSPAREGLAYLEKACQVGMDSGNHYYVGYSNVGAVYLHHFLGTRLNELSKEIKKTMTFFARAPNSVSETVGALEVFCDMARAEDEAAFASLSQRLDLYVKSTDGAMQAIGAQQAMLAHILFATTSPPPGLARLADRTVQKYFPTVVRRVTHYAYHSLLLADEYPLGGFWRRMMIRRTLRRNERKMLVWARNSPDNFSHYLHLIRAEAAAIRGNFKKALIEYEASAVAAEEQGFIRDRAIVNERAAKLCQAHGLVNLSTSYLAKARRAYDAWGATYKVRELERVFPVLVEPSELGPTRLQDTNLSTTTSRIARIDISTIVRASQALSGERDLTDLLKRLMKMLIETAGAQRGYLILDRKKEFRLAATFDADEVTVGMDQPLDGLAIASSVLQYVARTHESVVLDHATSDDRFQYDPHIARTKVLSILCMALIHQGRLIGILYLEHHEMRFAFSPDRIAFLDVIASQAAIAVENVVLYTQIKATNQSLEAQVEERTMALERTLADLWGEMDLAKKIQTILLPPDGMHGHYGIAAMMRPADQVGGDYYDIIPVHEKTWVLIGDVSGHGITAGLIMMMVQTSIRTVLSEQTEILPSMLLSRVNQAVMQNLEKIGRNDYMTIQAFCFEENKVTYAGLHQEVLIYRSASNQVEMCSELNGMWIGIVPDIQSSLVDNHLDIGIGDIVLLFTDGITEAKLRNQLLEVTGLATIFQRAAAEGLRGTDLIAKLFSAVDDRSIDDDVSLMVVERSLMLPSSS